MRGYKLMVPGKQPDKAKKDRPDKTSWSLTDRQRSVCLVNSRGVAHLAALGLVSVMLLHVMVKAAVLAGLSGMHKTGCFGKA